MWVRLMHGVLVICTYRCALWRLSYN
jgi:hypothetical protein